MAGVKQGGRREEREQVRGICRARSLRALEANGGLFSVGGGPLLAVRSDVTRIKQNVELLIKCRGYRWKVEDFGNY